MGTPVFVDDKGLLAAKVLGVILGLILGVMTAQWLGPYVLAPLAFLGGIAAAIVVYLLTVKIIASALN